MKNLNIYCITIYDEHIQLIKDFDYLPVGLGNKIQSKYFIRDNTKIQMSKKTLTMENILFIIGCGKMV